MDERGFAERLKAAIEFRGYTQGQLESRTEYVGEKVSQSYISRLVQGKQSPSLSVLVALAQALDVSLDWLAGLPKRDPQELDPIEDKLLASFRKIEDEDVRQLVLGFVEQQIKIDKKIKGERT